MTPLINVGEKIDVIQADQFQLFDIIVFWQYDRMICHFVTKVDLPLNTSSLKNHVDYPIKKEMILGKVTNYKLTPWLKIKFLLGRIFKGS